jgi:hypothetical protein
MKRRISLLSILLVAAGILWAVAYATDRIQVAKAQPSHAAALPGIGIDPTLERNMELATRNAPSRMRAWRAEVAKDLAAAQQNPAAQQAAAADRAALARIDVRLQQLAAH